MKKPAPSPFAAHWSLDPDVVFLNHGSFGACPLPVLSYQSRIRARMERGPVSFLVRELEPLLDEARAALAGFVGAEADDIAFVPNATTGVNTVLRSLSFEEGDELLTTTHEYNASRNALDFVAERSGASVRVVDIPFPIASSDVVLARVMDAVTPCTRLCLIDHVTSLTGVVMPAEDLCVSLAKRGVDTLVDGAHAPGMLPLHIDRLGATYYTGNCHKWMCAPKGAAFLWVRRDKQEVIRPLTISHGANAEREDRSRFRLEFDWTGTWDPSAYLAVPEALRFLASLLPGGWEQLIESNRSLALRARRILTEALDAPVACPDEMIGTLAAVPLGRGTYHFTTTALSFDPMEEILRERYGIEVPVLACPSGPAGILRISAQIYNTAEQYAYLADAVSEISSIGISAT
ncbi:MAG: aminotransferase class V-fold PLP-dependent enzyme [Candidatus Eisenbacteria bacterium]|nr:aminotransferase class V-fold PLP-dependent enzyme [Candidatus Eisenbacteria bacterium]